MIKFNNRKTKYSLKLSASLVIVSGLLSICFMSTMFTHSAKATGETYTYGNSGAQIGGTGGVLGPDTVLFNKSVSTYVKQAVGSTALSIFSVDSIDSGSSVEKYMMYSGSVQVTVEKKTCIANVEIFVKFGNSANGVVVPSPNDDTSYIAPMGSTVINPCTAAAVSNIKEFFWQDIKIGGNTSSTTQITATDKKAENMQISVTVYSDKKASELPTDTDVTVGMVSVPKSSVESFSPTSNTLELGDTLAVDQVFFKNVADGTYKICVTPENIFSFKQCQTVTKGNAYLNVYFGTPETVYYVDGKVVEATVSIALPSPIPQGVYGPIMIVLEDADSKIISKSDTDTHTLDETESRTDPIILKTKFDDVEPGIYKVCIKDNPDLCSAAFTKKINTKVELPDAKIDVTDDKSAKFLTAPSNTTSCAIEGIGWIVCPVIKFMGNIIDFSWNIIEGFLKTDTSTVQASNTSPAYSAWKAMRDVANIVFIIAFLIIIFSQMTSVGVSNYGIKKSLPKLIVSVILVNLSFYICQIGVDLSNIIGSSLKGVLDGLAGSVYAPKFASGTSAGGIILGVVGVAGAGAAMYAGLATLIPVLLAGVVAIAMVLFLLIARQVIIVMLVVIAPLAFVALLLPNTEKLFDKWKKLFTSMMLLYPIVAFVMGGSSLAAVILANSFGDTNAGSNSIAQIAAAAVGILPLFIIPGLLKKSLDGVGNIGPALNKVGAKMGGALGKVGGSAYGNSKLGQFQKYQKDNSRWARRRAFNQNEANTRRGLIQSGQDVDGSGAYGKWRSASNRKYNESKRSGSFGDRSLARGFAIADIEDEKVMKSSNSLLSNFTLDNGHGVKRTLTNREKIDFAKGSDIMDSTGTKVLLSAKDEYMKRAAVEQSGKIASVDEAHELVDASSGWSLRMRKALAATIPLSGAVKKSPWLGGKTLGDIEQGTASSNSAIQSAINTGSITPEVLLSGDSKSLAHLYNYANSTPKTSKERAILKEAVTRVRTDPLYKNRAVKGSDIDIALKNITTL